MPPSLSRAFVCLAALCSALVLGCSDSPGPGDGGTPVEAAQAVQEVGIEWAVEQCQGLIEQDTAGIHFYTLNNSDATMRIFRSLGFKDASSLR